MGFELSQVLEVPPQAIEEDLEAPGDFARNGAFQGDLPSGKFT